MLARMSPEARELCLKEVFPQAVKNGQPDAAASQLVHSDDFLWTPASIEKFITDPYYLGSILHDGLYPKLLDDLIELFSGSYSEVLPTGCSLDCLVYEEDGGLPTLGELIGSSPRVLTLLDAELSSSQSAPRSEMALRPVLLLTLANGSAVKLTPDHRIRVWKGKYEWVEARNLAIDDLVVVPRRIRTRPTSSLGIAEAKLLGYWVGDGSASETRARYVDGRRATGEEVISLLRVLGFDGYLKPKGNSWEVHVRRTKRSGFLAWLKAHERFQPGNSAIVPACICKASDEVVAAFLNRLWACEGTVYCNKEVSPPRIQLGVCSERLVRQVQALLLRFDIMARVTRSIAIHKRTGKKQMTWTLIVGDAAGMRQFLSVIGIVYSKETECQRLSSYLNGVVGNSNVDIVPLNPRELSMRMTTSKISRRIASKWWQLASRPRGFISRRAFEEWLCDFGDTRLGKDLQKEFPPDIGFEKVKRVEPLALHYPVGDAAVEKANRFIANLLNVQSSIGCDECQRHLDNNQTASEICG